MEDEVKITMEARHKKEKKELQAQIQALKKTAKNDKTKKKDIAAEISKLEFGLESRQSLELEANSEPLNASSVENLAEEVVKTKISKAQKRRDKKSQSEKERNLQIKLQETQNLLGPRNIELQAIQIKLKENKLKLFIVPSDGDCLYKAVSHQLEYARQRIVSVDELRNLTANYIKQHKEEFLLFMTNPETCDMLTDDEFENYCKSISETKVWGGQLEIKALSKLLQCPIHVIQSTSPNCIEQGTEFNGSPLIITYHRHMYSLGEHYNSTQNEPIADDNTLE